MVEVKETISISKDIVDKINLKIKNPQIGFDTVDEYVEHVLNGVLENEQESDEISEEETKRIQEELKKMGYI